MTNMRKIINRGTTGIKLDHWSWGIARDATIKRVKSFNLAAEGVIELHMPSSIEFHLRNTAVILADLLKTASTISLKT
ncbi:hypothetical protein SDC9_163473 [bioreactor metagenome]|uniref:Uncharacterized protein n=1 Tax=bioreactor metagenome TaxID=1076179 RepID=A0A645FNY0_9ZZZZ